MAGEEVVVNTSVAVGELIEQIFPAVLERFGFAITILKAAGIVFIGYVVYLIIKGILRFRDRKRLKIIEKKVLDIDRKLDKLLSLKKNKKKGKK